MKSKPSRKKVDAYVQDGFDNQIPNMCSEKLSEVS